MLALLEAYLGYSLVDDLMSGMGLVIGYSVGLSIPFVGQNLMNWLFDGMFPGSAHLWPPRVPIFCRGRWTERRQV